MTTSTRVAYFRAPMLILAFLLSRTSASLSSSPPAPSPVVATGVAAADFFFDFLLPPPILLTFLLCPLSPAGVDAPVPDAASDAAPLLSLVAPPPLNVDPGVPAVAAGVEVVELFSDASGWEEM